MLLQHFVHYFRFQYLQFRGSPESCSNVGGGIVIMVGVMHNLEGT